MRPAEPTNLLRHAITHPNRRRTDPKDNSPGVIGELCKYLDQTGVKKHHQAAQEHQCPYNLSAAHFLFQDKYAGNHHANWLVLPNHLRSGRTQVLQG